MLKDCFNKRKKEMDREGKREGAKNTGTKGKMAMSKYLSIISLNVKGVF